MRFFFPNVQKKRATVSITYVCVHIFKDLKCLLLILCSRKLTYVVLGLVSMQFLCFLLGAVVSPTPNSSMQYLATKCVDEKGGEDEDAWFYPRGGKGKCNPIQVCPTTLFLCVGTIFRQMGGSGFARNLRVLEIFP